MPDPHDSALAGAILDTVRLPLLALDAHLRVHTANDAFLQDFQVTREETIGRLIYELGNNQWDIPELRRLLSDILPAKTTVSDYRVEHDFERIGRRIMLLNARRVIRPDQPDLILLAISDETDREALRAELNGRIELANKITDSVREGLLILEPDLRVQSASGSFYQLFQVDPAQTSGRLVYELGNGQWDIPELRRLLEEVLPRQRSFDDYEVTHTFESLGRRVMILNGRRLDHLNLVLLAIRDITVIRDSEAKFEETLREGADRQAFLLELSDALRTLADPVEIKIVAARLLGERLSVNRIFYADASEGRWLVAKGYEHDIEPLPDRPFEMAKHGQWIIDHLRSGRPFVVTDMRADPRFNGPERQEHLDLQIGAEVAIPLVKDGELLAMLVAHVAERRDWSERDLTLLEGTAERTWSSVVRARAEAALRENEARLRKVLDIETVGVAFFDFVGGIRDANSAFLRMIGYTRDELDAGTIRYEELTPLQWRWRDEQTITELREQRKSGPFEKEYIHKDGSRFWILCASKALDEHSAVEFIIDITERKRAEAALRESEERFQQFANASSGALWIRDAQTLAMEYASPAIAKIYGVEAEALLGAVRRWAALIVPEDRDKALDHIEAARRGESVVHEFRIQRPSDESFRWIRNTGFPLRSAVGTVQRIGGIAEDATEAKLAVEHQAILLAELQHRVRNIMAMIRSVTVRTAETAGSVEDYSALMTGRVSALARTQTLLTRAANAGVQFAQLVHSELEAHAQHHSLEMSGPDIAISPKAAEVLTLAIHELTTNALKYGALSVPEGRIKVSWSTEARDETSWLSLRWREERPAALKWHPPARRGFGSDLIEKRVPYELGGIGKVKVAADGVDAQIAFPLQRGASILETDAPPPSHVFGGSIDTSGVTDLVGKRVLVLEDDYYLAGDAARALQNAGADVVGPFPTVAAALAAVRDQNLDAAIVDINLGTGASFETAEALRSQRVPFIFLTGYDSSVIPERFSDVQRFQKPAELKQVVRAVGDLVA